MKQIFRIFTLIAVAMLTAGQAWAGTSFGKISYSYSSNDGGALQFYTDAECSTANKITLTNGKSSALTNSTVYIKATPAFGYAFDIAEEGIEVTFIKAEVTAGTGAAGARTRSGETIEVGDFLAVSATATKGVYQITMPTDEKLNVTVTATFPAKSYQTGVSYIQADGTEATTPDGVKVWVLDGTEGEELGQSDSKTWYICNSSMAYDHRLKTLGDVNIIMSGSLAIGTAESPVNYEGIDANNNLCLYGQASATGTNSVKVNSNMQSIKSSSGAITITNCSLDLTSEGLEGIYAKNGVTITGCAAGTNNVKIKSHYKAIYSSYGAVSITNCSVDLTSTNNSGIDANNDVTITGCDAGTNSVKVNSKLYSINSYGAVSITNCSVDLTSTNNPGIDANNDVTITGCAAGTNSVKVNSNMFSICSSGAVSITNCSVDLTSTNDEGINAKNDVTITGCAAGTNSVKIKSYDAAISSYSGAVSITNCSAVDVEVTTTGWNGIQASSDLTITGGQVTVTLPESSSSYGLYSNGNIILDWINSTDFVLVPSICCSNAEGSIQFAEGKRFYAYNGTEIEAVYDANMLPTKTNGIYSGLAGRKLTPCTDIFVKLADGVTGVTVSATGGENVTVGTNTWYKVAKGAEVTLSATDSNKQLGSVEITGATATQGDGTFTFTIGESDVTVTAATFLEKVTYIDPTVEGDNKTKTVFATPLTGSETTLGAGWYVVNKDIDYTTVDNNSVVLTATGDVNFILADDKTMNIGSAATPVEGYGIRFNSSASLAIYGQGAKQNGSTEGSLNIYTGNFDPISLVNDITIYGGNVTVGDGLAPNGKFTIHGGTFNDPRTTYSSGPSAINAAEINICGGTVTSVNRLYGNGNGTGNVTISGGEVSVHSIQTTKGSVTISGGQVTLADVISETDIILGWTNAATDFIKASGYYCGESGTLSIANDQALMSDDGAKVFSGSIANNNFTLNDINGKTLKPALMITLPTGVTATGTNVVTSETAGTYAISGTTVTLDGSNYTAPDGLTLNGFTVKDADGTTVTVSNGSFTMPAKAVTVSATFSVSYTDGTITKYDDGYSVELTDGENTNPLPVDGEVKDLDYRRTLSGPGSGSTGDTEINGNAVNLFTVCLPFAPKTGTGVKYYTLNSVNDKTLKFIEITGDPVAFTPYMVAVTSNVTDFKEQCNDVSFNTDDAITSKTVTSTNNKIFTFTGTLTGLTSTDAAAAAGTGMVTYILQHQAKWGKVVSGKDNVKIPPFRAYITGPDVTVSGARELDSSFEGEDDATGIQNILTVDRDGTERWYDLNGRRIDKPTSTQKGVYIQSGRKVVVK